MIVQRVTDLTSDETPKHDVKRVYHSVLATKLMMLESLKKLTCFWACWLLKDTAMLQRYWAALDAETSDDASV